MMARFPPDAESIREGDLHAASPVLTVSLLVSSARLILERQLGVVWVAGEISNLYRAASGHVYFTLKDPTAQVKCTFWRSKARLLEFPLADGLAVEVRALPSMYDQRGEFQLNVDSVRLAGLGALYERFARLKAKLEAAGWLAPERKRRLPRFPRTVGVVTSPRGAAIFDVLATLARRWPVLGVIVYPTAVQGDGAAAEIAQAIATANARAEVDVLIVCRGGGSIEDLWPFNEEDVARAVFESALPIVSGVGHETDFTICDFVADVRAPTPTAAATLVPPDCGEFRRRAGQFAGRLARAGAHAIATRSQRVDVAARRLIHPAARLFQQRDRLAGLFARLARSWSRQSAQRNATIVAARLRLVRELRAPRPQAARLGIVKDMLAHAARDRITHETAKHAALAQSLAHLNPQAVLERGYAIVATAEGEIVTDSAQIARGDDVAMTFARGRANARILESEEVRK